MTRRSRLAHLYRPVPDYVECTSISQWEFLSRAARVFAGSGKSHCRTLAFALALNEAAAQERQLPQQEVAELVQAAFEGK